MATVVASTVSENPARLRRAELAEFLRSRRERLSPEQVGVIYLGRRRNSYLEGLTPAQSDALLDALWAFAEQPQFVYAHRWRVGDLVLWDNRSTMHRRDPFDNAARRVMHRTQIKGKWQPRAYDAAA